MDSQHPMPFGLGAGGAGGKGQKKGKNWRHAMKKLKEKGLVKVKGKHAEGPEAETGESAGDALGEGGGGGAGESVGGKLGREEELHNLCLIFQFMKARGILEAEADAESETTCKPADVVDGNPPLTLRAVWAIVEFSLCLEPWCVCVCGGGLYTSSAC